MANPFLNLNAHWYHHDGTPAHEIDGHPTTMGDVRKHNLKPSVTNILSVVGKPGLDAWKQREAALAALRSPYGLDEDRTLEWVAEEFKRTTEEAANLGTKIHKDIGEWIPWMTEDQFNPGHKVEVPGWFDAEFSRLNCEVIAIESPFSCDTYGGCVDFIGWLPDEGREIIVDWKTQKTNPYFSWWKSWPIQLAAYAHGVGLPDAKLVNVAISTTEEGKIKTKVWDKTEYWYDEFLKVFEVWKGPLGKNYDPRGG